MHQILIAEIKYFRYLLAIVLSLPVSFSVCAVGDLHLFTETYFLSKYFWSIIIAMGIYGLVFIIWTIRAKENRDHMHAALPVGIKSIGYSRFIFGLAPMVGTAVYFEILNIFLPGDQHVFVDRINAQLGLMLIFLVSYDLIANTAIAVTSRNSIKRKYFLIAFIAISIIVTSMALIFAMSNSLLPALPFGERIYFFIWGIILAVCDTAVFNKRNSY